MIQLHYEKHMFSCYIDETHRVIHMTEDRGLHMYLGEDTRLSDEDEWILGLPYQPRDYLPKIIVDKGVITRLAIENMVNLSVLTVCEMYLQ